MHIELPNTPELDYQSVTAALSDYAFPRKSLADMVRRGTLLRIKKGLYVQSAAGIAPPSREILANMLYGPSHISYEYALSAHGLIPESVPEVTSATTGKSREFDSPVGRFTYCHQNPAYYAVGFERRALDERRGFLMAHPEKALADRVLLERGRFSVRGMRQFVFENLRVDEHGFRQLDVTLLELLARRSGRQALSVLTALRRATP